MDEVKLKELGFEKAANDLVEQKEFKRKCSIAYEHYRYVKQERIDNFNEALHKKTVKENPNAYVYDKLALTDIKEYPSVPPADVLTKLEEAQKLGCFDHYEIGHIQSVKERKDPILFGCIKKCADRFFIAQWDDDVKIEDLIKENEG